jgi:hypothetical protein
MTLRAVSGHGPLDNLLVEVTLNLPAWPFKMHIAEAKGGWMCPAANLVRRTPSCDVQAQNYFFFFAFFFFAFFAMVELLC